ncbi:MAG: cupin [Devosia sp.]|nr:cupin [Devosia sp.]
MSAEEIIALLGLEPHPEGGWYRQTFADTETTTGRAHSTAIYYLLKAGEQSAWHRVDAIEIWHWHAGAPLELRLSNGHGTETLILGNDFIAGQRPQGIVPRHGWQSARSLGNWTLVGCTVAPGFEFAGFELAAPGWEPDTTL